MCISSCVGILGYLWHFFFFLMFKSLFNFKRITFTINLDIDPLASANTWIYFCFALRGNYRFSKTRLRIHTAHRHCVIVVRSNFKAKHFIDELSRYFCVELTENCSIMSKHGLNYGKITNSNQNARNKRWAKPILIQKQVTLFVSVSYWQRRIVVIILRNNCTKWKQFCTMS